MNENLVDMDTLAVFKDLAEEEFQPMMVEYVNYLESTIPVIRDQFPGGNLDEARLASHSVKSTSLQLGFQPMGEIAREVETCCRELKLAGADALRDKYLELATATLSAAQDLIGD